jgi:MYXO-CTERM domain-containing protein
VFGGTSGASPHVTGVAALLAQAGLHSDAARDALRTGAWVDGTTGAVPNATYGYGRLNAAGAFGVTTVETGAPSITLAVSPTAPTTAGPAEIIPTVDGADGGATGLQVKWDDGYDGTWDTAYAAPAPHTIMSKAAADLPFKARVRDAAGHVAEAVIWVKFTQAAQGSDAGADGGADAGAGRGDAGDDAGGGGGSSGKSGCSCRAAGAGSRSWPASLVGVLLAAAAVRRRRSARVD